MPYIDPERRQGIERPLVAASLEISNAGELNFAITKLLCNYVSMSGILSYSRINDIIGVLDCVGKEFYRRVAAPYEDAKKEINGDVYQDILGVVT